MIQSFQAPLHADDPDISCVFVDIDIPSTSIDVHRPRGVDVNSSLRIQRRKVDNLPYCRARNPLQPSRRVQASSGVDSTLIFNAPRPTSNVQLFKRSERSSFQINVSQRFLNSYFLGAGRSTSIATCAQLHQCFLIF